MNFLDTHPDVLEWSSEELIIPYRCPLTNKVRRYYPDFVLTQRNKDGEIERKIVEIKPLKETSPPQKPKTKSQSKRYLTEAATFAKNQAKWEAAIDYCRRNKYTFQIITEKELGITNGVRPLPRIR